MAALSLIVLLFFSMSCFILIASYFNWISKAFDALMGYFNPKVTADEPIINERDYFCYVPRNYDELETRIKNLNWSFEKINTPDRFGYTFFDHLPFYCADYSKSVMCKGALLKMGTVDLKQKSGSETHLQKIVIEIARWAGVAKFLKRLVIGFAIALIHQIPEFRSQNEDEFIVKLKKAYPQIFFAPGTDGICNYIPYFKKGFKEAQKLSLVPYAFMVLHSDKFLEFSDEPQPLNEPSSKARRFFEITEQLPQEIQMRLGRILVADRVDVETPITGKEAEQAFSYVCSS